MRLQDFILAVQLIRPDYRMVPRPVILHVGCESLNHTIA